MLKNLRIGIQNGAYQEIELWEWVEGSLIQSWREMDSLVEVRVGIGTHVCMKHFYC